MDTRSPALTTLLSLFIYLCISGCVSVQQSKAIETEHMLTASGFQMKPADTPAQLAHIKTLPQRQLEAHHKDGELFYVYADAQYCKCIYAGPKKAQQRYHSTVMQKGMYEAALDAEKPENPMIGATPMHWDLWLGWDAW